MSKRIVLKKSPKIEFQFQEKGFLLIDEQTEKQSGFYAYDDLKSIEITKGWYPRFAQWMRAFTWILNGVPFFPDAESCKKANIKMRLGKTSLGMWLTDTYMADKAQILKKALDEKLRAVISQT